MTQTIITILPFEKAIETLRDGKARLQDDGTFFVICSTDYDPDGNVIHDFLDVISEATALGYTYINTIVYPTKSVQNVAFKDNVRYVVWLCKSYSLMTVKKDAIREKHIWKDVEWGKRAKNYNPKGKDPGNVWIPTEDDGCANITDHILLSDQEVVDRLRALADCGNNCEIYQETLPVCASAKFTLTSPVTPSAGNCQGRVVFGTSEKMDSVSDGTVSVAVTSPPYWNLKDYFKQGQIGQEGYDVYLHRMKTVWTECYKKLSPKGSLWININIRVQAGKVISIPHDFVTMCKEIGFYYKGILIWHKSSGIPTSDKNIVDRHEYVLLFTKSNDFCVNQDIQASFGDYKNPDMNGGAFWNINRKAGSVGKKYIHPAIYPNELVERIVQLSTHDGELVIDPFLGSGTSLIAALQCHRNFIGYEYNEGFKDLMQSRYDKELPENTTLLYV
ncbi:MAG: site-specific DNA-methyltransferase [Clostridia bacterium]|nr:site-specific DNA-methyltransferase [Clostridia bacterium]